MIALSHHSYRKIMHKEPIFTLSLEDTEYSLPVLI
jgi:hypothetical protein